MTFRPMLASPADLRLLRYPVFVSPKLDGIRCIVRDGVAMSRTLKPIPNEEVQRKIGRPVYNGFDGELIVGDFTASDVFNRTSSCVMSRDNADLFTFWIFDDASDPLIEFHRRLGNVSTRLARNQTLHIAAVPHMLVGNEAKLRAAEEQFLARGFEGVMLRTMEGPYKHGRSTVREGWLLKLKRFEDAEAEVLGALPWQANLNAPTTDALGYTERSTHKAGKVPLEKLGALRVRDLKTGVEFEIGTGFDDAQRRSIWREQDALRGKIVKYKHQPMGAIDKPRFPVFLGWRHPDDMD